MKLQAFVRQLLLAALLVGIFPQFPGVVTIALAPAARAQGLRLCIGDDVYRYCEGPCKSAQCFADEKRASQPPPPRGRVEVFCRYSHWIQRNDYYRPRTDLTFFYARFQYDEVESRAVEAALSRAWSDHVKSTQAAPQPALRPGEKLDSGGGCAIYSDGSKDFRKRDSLAVETDGSDLPIQRLDWIGAARPLSAAERAAAEKAEAARAVAEATQRREAADRAAAAEAKRLAAEAARKAEAARVEGERQSKVDAIASQIGPGKRAAAERLARMNEELAALRPKPKVQPRQCTTRSFSQVLTNTASSQSTASQSLATAIARKSGANIGGSESVVSMTGGAPSCTQETVLTMKPPPVGKCLACISEALAAQFGWVPGKGYPPPKVEWVCKATVQVTAEKCGTGSAKVSAQ